MIKVPEKGGKRCRRNPLFVSDGSGMDPDKSSSFFSYFRTQMHELNILIGATGSVASIKIPELVKLFKEVMGIDRIAL